MSSRNSDLRRFAIFTHVEHFCHEGEIEAYAPYVREMNIWLNWAEAVEIVAPEVAEGRWQEIPYEHHSLTFTKVPGFNFLSLYSSIKAIMKFPTLFFRIVRAMAQADHLHLRCPGNVGLLACVAQIFFPGKPKTAKYAGNWDPKAKQPWTYKLQRRLLNNTFLTKNMQVLIYGEWPGQSENIRSFFTASFPEKTIIEVQEKNFEPPYVFVFVGNLVPGKGLKMAVALVQELMERGASCSLEIYGEGPERKPVEKYIESSGLKGIEFKGSQPLEELKKAYQRAHFLVLPSRSEGWPKAVAEAMFFGCIPIATAVSCVPWMLGNGSRGILLKTEFNGGGTEDTEKDAKRIIKVLGDKERMKRMSEEAKRWSQKYTLERFEEGIEEVLGKRSPAEFADLRRYK